MNIVVAPDSFKESLTALEVAVAIRSGFERVFSEASYTSIPMADGGEGTLQSLIDATSGRVTSCEVLDPLGRSTTATYGVLGDEKTAVVEVAEASGLHLLDPLERDPKVATSYGTGELIRAALDDGFRHFIIGLGGSATNDGGVGALRALGVQFFKRDGTLMEQGGIELLELASIDLSEMHAGVPSSTFTVACDVDNPLVGPTGASAVYGPQKGGTEEDVKQLDRALDRFGEVVEQELGCEIRNVAGAGAAGGIGGGFAAFLKAQLTPGVDIVAQATGLSRHLLEADLVLTGEGEINSQTVYGKTPVGVAKLAAERNIPVIAFTAKLGDGYQEVYNYGVTAVECIAPGPITVEESMEQAAALLSDAAERVAKTLLIGRRIT